MPLARSEIEFDSVSKSYRLSGGSFLRPAGNNIKEPALKDISFRIQRGEIVGLVGKNGAGKSTLLRLACGILRPSSGRIRLLGIDPVKEQTRILGRLGFIIGARSRLIWDLPARDSFNLHKAIYSLPERQFKRRLAELEEDFDLHELLDRTVRELSLGQRMRVDIALAFLHEPEVLLLDEATIALDSVTKHRFRRSLGATGKRMGTTIFLASNDLEDVRTVCQRILILSGKTLIYDGNLKDLYLLKGMSEHLTVTVSSVEDIVTVSDDFEREGFVASRIKRNDLSIVYSISGELERAKIVNHAGSLVGKTLRKFEWSRPSLEDIVERIG